LKFCALEPFGLANGCTVHVVAVATAAEFAHEAKHPLAALNTSRATAIAASQLVAAGTGIVRLPHGKVIGLVSIVIDHEFD
jgi:hypothetical protein